MTQIYKTPCKYCGDNDYLFCGRVLYTDGRPMTYRYQCKPCGRNHEFNRERMDIADHLGMPYSQINDDVVADYRAVHPAGAG